MIIIKDLLHATTYMLIMRLEVDKECYLRDGTKQASSECEEIVCCPAHLVAVYSSVPGAWSDSSEK